MLCIYYHWKRCAISDKKVITLMETLGDSLYSYIQPFSFLKNDFSPNFSLITLGLLFRRKVSSGSKI